MAEIWAPTLVEVAGCIPTRTADVTNPGSDEYLNTFTDNTRPTGVQAQVIIDHAVSDVKAAVTSVTPALESVAKNAAMWRAAADIELAYPDRNADIDTYRALDERARYEWDRFLEAAGNQGSSTNSGTPLWAMPVPAWWGDRNDI